MPLYEYECQACGNRLEVQQRLADAPLVKCPQCGKDQLEKVISATAFVLKGGGWYKDLYSSSKPGESSTSSTPKSSSSSSTESKSSDSSSTTSTPSTTPSSGGSSDKS